MDIPRQDMLPQSKRNNDMPAKHERRQLDLTTKTDKSHAPKSKRNMQQKIYIRTNDIVKP